MTEPGAHTTPPSVVSGIIIPRKTWVPFLAGALGGGSAACLTAPLDVVKTRLQSDFYRVKLDVQKSHSLKHGDTGIATMRSIVGAWNVLRHLTDTGRILRGVYHDEGFRALFKGLGPTLTAVVPARAVNFYVYNNGQRFLNSNLRSQYPSDVINFLAAVHAGFWTSTLTNPIWVVKTRLQLDKEGSRRYRNSFDCVKQIIRGEGPRGFMRGLSASYLGITESTIQWVLWERFKIMFKSKGGKSQDGDVDTVMGRALSWVGRVVTTGFLAKTVATVITYPHEVARTRLRQAPSLSSPFEQRKYQGLLRVFATVWREEGIQGLYGGMTPHLLKSVPAAIVYYVVYEAMIDYFEI